MGKIDRRRKTKLKISRRIERKKEINAKYSSEDGGYMSVLFITASKKIRSDDYIEFLKNSKKFQFFDKSDNKYSVKSKRKNMNFMFIDGDDLSDLELCYMSRYCDMVVVCTKDNIDYGYKIDLLCRQTSRIIFCYYDREDSVYLKEYLINSKIEFKMIFKDIMDIPLLNLEKREAEPIRDIIIPNKCYFDKESCLNCEVFLEKGLVSDKFICNGSHLMEIESIIVGKSSQGNDIFDENRTLDQEIMQILNNGIEMHLYENRKEQESAEDNFSIDNLTISEKNNFLSYRFKDYNSFKDTLDNSIEESNKKNGFHTIRKIITEKYSYFFKGKRVIFKFKKTSSINQNSKIWLIANIFNFEGRKVAHNIYFKSKVRPIKHQELLLLDNGIKPFEFKPILTESSNDNFFKLKKSLSTGVMSFIGPFFCNVERVIIFETSLNFLDWKCYIAEGSILNFQDRFIVEERKFKGEPYKIYKRSCVIRNMFSNRVDIDYFRKYELKTGRNNSGIIKDAIGTHGMFKAYFNRPIKHGEVATMAIYRRVYLL